MRFYEHSSADPEWLATASRFHGHLGPWLVIGLRIGRDAIERLNTLGYWDIDVICWMPVTKQRPPFSCILDGLQAGSGATLGKQNIRFDDSPRIVTDEQPVIHVVRRTNGPRANEGLSYRLKANLIATLADVHPANLEAVARTIATADISDLFDIRPLLKHDPDL